MLAMLERGEPVRNLPVQFRSKQGGVVVAQFSAVILGAHDDLVLSALVNITELTQTTQALRRSEQWLERALAAGDMGLWEWDLTTDDMQWSSGVSGLLGMAPATSGGTYAAFVACVHEKDRARLVNAMRRAVNEGKSYELTHRVLLGDGSTRWLAARGEVVRDDQGKALRITGSLVNVTARQRAEEERRLFALIVERATDFIAMAGLDGRILYVNDAGLRMVGLASLAEARTKRVGQLLTPEGTEHSLKIELPAVLVHGHWEGEGQLVHFVTGKRIDVLTSSFLVRDPVTGEPVCSATIRRDVSARRALDEQLRQSQKMDVIGRLSAGIAHDFNNLLAVILGMAGSLLARRNLDERARADVADIEAAALRAADLTRQLSTFGRRQTQNPRALDLNEIVTETTKLARRVLTPAIDLQLSLSPSVVPARLDSSQFEQVLMNLIVNARDAMPQGGAITITTRAEDELVFLTARDTGSGMTADVRERAFEPFFTTKSEGSGTGLGLATVYGIIQQSGGQVTLESEPGCGTLVEIRLPRTREPVQSIARKSARPDGVAGGTILLVNDQEYVLTALRRSLEDQGHRVIGTTLPENAVRIFLAHASTIDLIVSDVRMPGMDGYELVRRCRGDPRRRESALRLGRRGGLQDAFERPVPREALHQRRTRAARARAARRRGRERSAGARDATSVRRVPSPCERGGAATRGARAHAPQAQPTGRDLTSSSWTESPRPSPRPPRKDSSRTSRREGRGSRRCYRRYRRARSSRP